MGSLAPGTPVACCVCLRAHPHLLVCGPVAFWAPLPLCFMYMLLSYHSLGILVPYPLGRASSIGRQPGERVEVASGIRTRRHLRRVPGLGSGIAPIFRVVGIGRLLILVLIPVPNPITL